MNQKTALYLSMALTVFVLVAITTVALAWPTIRQATTSPQTETQQAEVVAPSQASTFDGQDLQNTDIPTLMATVEARDAAYRAQIEQANQQLKEAYQQIQELQAQNQMLLEREQIYQQRLQESAQTIQTMMDAQSSSSAPMAFQTSHHDSDDFFEHEDHD